MKGDCRPPRDPTASSNRGLPQSLGGASRWAGQERSDHGILTFLCSGDLAGAAEDFLDPGILKLCPAREKCQGKGRGHGSLVTDRGGAPGSCLGAPALLSTLPAPSSAHTDGETNCDLRNASDLTSCGFQGLAVALWRLASLFRPFLDPPCWDPQKVSVTSASFLFFFLKFKSALRGMLPIRKTEFYDIQKGK